jgi:hypothetical protein
MKSERLNHGEWARPSPLFLKCGALSALFYHEINKKALTGQSTPNSRRRRERQ